MPLNVITLHKHARARALVTLCVIRLWFRPLGLHLHWSRGAETTPDQKGISMMFPSYLTFKIVPA